MRILGCAFLLVAGALTLALLWVWSKFETRASIVWSHQEGDDEMEEVTIHVGHSRLAHFKAEAADGDPVPPAGPIVWTSDDDTKIALDPTPDGSACTVRGLAITSAPVLIHATDGLTQATSAPISVVTEEETHSEITFDDEQRPA